jgi:O-antigen ligase
VLGYPAMLLVLLIASFFVTRIRNAVWGSGAYQASNEAREQQFSQGFELIARHPWGHGIGRAAETLGFTNLDGVITIDSYFLSVALEMGVIGFICYYGAFLAVLWSGSRELIKAGDREDTSWLAPTLLALGNFVVIKSILSQQENHPLAFLYLGMALALIALCRTLRAKEENPRPAD